MNRSKHRANTLKISLGVAASVLCLAMTAAIAQAPSAAPPAGAPAAQPGAPRAGGPATPRPPRNPVIPDASLRLPYTPVAAPKHDHEFEEVSGIAVNSKGNVIIFQRSPEHAVLEFDPAGKVVRDFTEIKQSRAHGLRVDASDNVWVTDVRTHTVTKVSPKGKILMTLGTSGQAGTWDEAAGKKQFNEPTDLGFGKNGDVFVATGHGGPDPRVVRFDKNGKFLNTWSLAHPDGSRANIHTIAVGPDGNVYAGDREVMKILVFKPDGTKVRELQMKNLVCGLYVDAKGNLWMAAGQDGMLLSLDWDGNVKGWTGKLGKGLNEYGEAHYLALTKDLSVMYVSDTVNRRFEKLVRNK